MTESIRTEIFAINLDAEAVVISYMKVPTDVRANGRVALQHQARLDLQHPDYAEDAETIRRLSQRMLNNALEDFENSEPWIPDEDDLDPDDEERGMGE